MQTLHSVPLIRASGMGPLPQVLEERVGISGLLKALEKEGLPFALCELPQLPIPARSIFGLFARASNMLGDRTLGLHIGRQMSYKAYGHWSRQIEHVEGLGRGLHNINLSSHLHQASGFTFEMEYHKRHVVWRVVRPRFIPLNIFHTDHLIFPMMDVVRDFLGPNWWPDWVEVDYMRDGEAGHIEHELGVPIRFGRKGAGIAIRHEDLPASRVRPFAISGQHPVSGDVLSDVALPDAPEPVRSFSAIVALRLHSGQSDIDGAARLTGIGMQGLQRRLRHAGYTYREVLEAARRKRALFLLGHTALPISDVAAALGYEDQSNFTRAFSRWTGYPPSRFRQMARGRTPAPGAPGH